MLSVQQAKPPHRTIIVGDVRLRIPEKFNTVPESFIIAERQPRVETIKQLTMSAQSSSSTDTISTSYSTNVADSEFEESEPEPQPDVANNNCDKTSNESDGGGAVYAFYEFLHMCGCYGRNRKTENKRAEASPDEIYQPSKSDVVYICGNLRTTAL